MTDRKPLPPSRRRLLRGLRLLIALMALLGLVPVAGSTQEPTPPPEAVTLATAPTAAEVEEKAERPPGTPLSEVTVGAYLNDVQTLDMKTHSYAVDLYVWFRWKDGELDPATSLGFINPSELWGHIRTTDYETPETLENGEKYQVLRVQGRFSAKLPLEDYPFDRQTLVVEFEDNQHGADRVVYKADARPLTVNPALKLPGFRIDAPQFSIDRHVYPTNFGDPREADRQAFSRVRIALPIHRPVLPQAAKVLLPVLCVLLGTAMMYLFAGNYVDSRVELGITSLLTVVALQVTMNDDLPDVAYLTLIDLVYIVTYLYVVAGLFVVVRTTRLQDAGDLGGVKAWSRRGLIVSSLVYAVTVAGLVVPVVVS